MEALEADEISFLQNELRNLEKELREQLKISEESAEVVQLDQTLVGRVSRMDAMQQQSMAVSTRAKAKLKLQKVLAALNCIEADDYGYCRQCDEAIGFPRLSAQPEAILCLRCQDKADQQAL